MRTRRSKVIAAALGVIRRVHRQGHGGVILIEGKPGIGKSAVFAETVTQASRMGFTCAVGKADQIGRISPAAPLLLALRSGPRPLLSATDLADLVTRTNEPLLLLEDVAGLLERHSQRGPLLIGIDDTQWADPVTRFVLRALPSRLAWPAPPARAGTVHCGHAGWGCSSMSANSPAPRTSCTRLSRWPS